MAYTIVEQAPVVVGQVESGFPSSPAQVYFHNRLVGELRAKQLMLETVEPHDLAQRQAEVRVLKALLVIIHKHDPKHLQEYYGTPD